MAEVITYKRELSFGWIDMLNSANALYGFVLGDVTAHTVNGVGRVDNYASIFQTFHYCL
jgi:hypothetical protein